MTEITTQELYEIYVDTLLRCLPTVRNLPDEELLCELFEEFDVQARSFLHEISLGKLHDAGLIDDDIIEESKEIRRRWIALESQEWTPEQIRRDIMWDELFKLCDSCMSKVADRNRK